MAKGKTGKKHHQFFHDINCTDVKNFSGWVGLKYLIWIKY